MKVFFCTFPFFLLVQLVNGANLELNANNWEKILKDEWLVKFFAPWCPACRSIEDTWSDLGKWAEENNYKIGSVDVTEEPALNGRFMVTALPTIYHVKDGVFRLYSSSRTLGSFKQYLEKKEWENSAPVSSWTSPTSVLMGGISSMFTLSMKLKNMHSTLSTEYGLPEWLSFALFGLGVIVIGLLLGIVVVLITDRIWEPSPPPYVHPTVEDKKKDDDITATEKSDEKIDDTDDTGVNGDDDGAVRHRKGKSSNISDEN